mgnify:FL=1
MSEKTQFNETVVTLPSDTEVQVERIFDAPRDLVWDCYTDETLVADWLGPRRLKMRIEKWDFRVGGKWHYFHIDEGGNEYEFFGEFREIEEPSKIVQTFNFVMEPQPPASLDSVEFVELDDGRTRLIANTTFESKEQRDGMVQSGMEKGMTESFERLEEILDRKQD